MKYIQRPEQNGRKQRKSYYVKTSKAFHFRLQRLNRQYLVFFKNSRAPLEPKGNRQKRIREKKMLERDTIFFSSSLTPANLCALSILCFPESSSILQNCYQRMCRKTLLAACSERINTGCEVKGRVLVPALPCMIKEIRQILVSLIFFQLEYGSNTLKNYLWMYFLKVL